MMKWGLFSPPKIALFLLGGFFVFMIPNFLEILVFEKIFLFEWEFIFFNGVMMVFSIFLDKISISFSMVVCLICFSVMLFSMTYMSVDTNLEYFVIIVLMFVLSMNFLIYFPHMFFLLIGWDGLGLTSYLLVIYYLSDKSLAAGMITIMTNRIGDSLLILVCSWALISGHWSFIFSEYMSVSFMMFGILVAAMTKSAQVPFSAWLPAAMAAPTPVSALVHSSTLVTAGIYLLIRFFFSLNDFMFFSSFCFFFGVITCLMASFSAIFENDLKKIIALSTLSQLGVMMFSLGMGQVMLSYFHLVTHALFKALLFICAGQIIHNNQNNQDIRFMGGVTMNMPVTSMSLNVANLSLCGIPFLSGFYSKDLIIEVFYINEFSFIMGCMLLLSVCLTSVYSMRLSVMILWSPYKGASGMIFSDESKIIMISYMLLLLGAVFGGCLLSWLMLPYLSLLVIPFFLKILVLMMILGLSMISFILLMIGYNFFGLFYFGSMMFLGYISSYPMNSIVFGLSEKLIYNEVTWFEMISGKGVSFFFSKLLNFVQKGSGMNFSYMLSMIGVIMVIIMYMI